MENEIHKVKPLASYKIVCPPYGLRSNEEERKKMKQFSWRTVLVSDQMRKNLSRVLVDVYSGI